MAISWFDTKSVEALADKLVSDLVGRVPPASLSASEKKVKEKNERAVSLVMREAGEFASSNPLNVYKKAKLANRFKWALIEAGYPKPFVDAIAFDLAAVMARKKSPQKA